MKQTSIPESGEQPHMFDHIVTLGFFLAICKLHRPSAQRGDQRNPMVSSMISFFTYFNGITIGWPKNIILKLILYHPHLISLISHISHISHIPFISTVSRNCHLGHPRFLDKANWGIPRIPGRPTAFCSLLCCSARKSPKTSRLGSPTWISCDATHGPKINTNEY